MKRVVLLLLRLAIIGLAVVQVGGVPVGGVLGQPPELKYIRAETRAASRRATLAQYQPDLQWSPWHLIGPFDNTGRDKHGVIYPPQIADYTLNRVPR